MSTPTSNSNPRPLPTCDFSGVSTNVNNNRPLYDVGGELQHLIPTLNDVVSPKEPSKEVKELQDVEDWLLNTNFACRCGSDGHADGLCEQNKAAWKVHESTSLEDIPAREQAARQTLSGGVTQGAPMCGYHAQELKEDLERRGVPFNAEAIISGSNEGLIAQTALLPMCKTCYADTTLPNSQNIPVKLDTCLCATGIVASSCYLCGIQRIDSTKSMVVTRRTEIVNGQEIIGCGCGRVREDSNARECTGCGGMMTLPTTNFAGNQLIFQAGARYPHIIPKQPATFQQMKYTPLAPSASRYGSVRPLVDNGNQQAGDQRPISPVSFHQPLFSAGDISLLRDNIGLNIATPITHTDPRTVRDPQSRLAKLSDSMNSPGPNCNATDVDNIMMICGFGDEARATAIKFMEKDKVYGGRVLAKSLNKLTARALNKNFRSYAGDITYSDGGTGCKVKEPTPEEPRMAEPVEYGRMDIDEYQAFTPVREDTCTADQG